MTRKMQMLNSNTLALKYLRYGRSRDFIFLSSRTVLLKKTVWSWCPTLLLTLPLTQRCWSTSVQTLMRTGQSQSQRRDWFVRELLMIQSTGCQYRVQRTGGNPAIELLDQSIDIFNNGTVHIISSYHLLGLIHNGTLESFVRSRIRYPSFKF